MVLDIQRKVTVVAFHSSVGQSSCSVTVRRHMINQCLSVYGASKLLVLKGCLREVAVTCKYYSKLLCYIETSLS